MELPAEVLGIENVDARNAQNNRRDGNAYNLQGQKVGDSYRGIVIKNGRKVLKR